MNMWNIILIMLLLTTPAFSQVTQDSSDLLDKIRSALNLNFKQADAIKPLVKAYASKLKQINSLDGLAILERHSLIKTLNQNLDNQLDLILTDEQKNTWQMARKAILPEASKDKVKKISSSSLGGIY